MMKIRLLQYSLVLLLILWVVSNVGAIDSEKAMKELNRRTIAYSINSFLSQINKGDTTAINLFLSAGMNPNSKDSTGKSALQYAVETGRLDITRQLVLSGADVRIMDTTSGRNLLHEASERGYTTLVEYLMELGLDINSKTRSGRTPLMLASMNGYLDIVKLLIQNDVQMNMKDNEGWTSLLLATKNKFPEIALFLLENGEFAVHKDKYGNSSLLYAASYGYTNLVRELIEFGSDVNEKSVITGETPLVAAIAEGQKDVVKILIQKGANMNLAGAGNITPLQMAKFVDNKDIIRLLHNAGARK